MTFLNLRVPHIFLTLLIAAPAILFGNVTSIVILVLITATFSLQCILTRTIASATLLFQSIQILNFLSLDAPIYHSQIIAFFSDPMNALLMTGDHVKAWNVTISSVYLIIGSYLIFKMKPLKNGNITRYFLTLATISWVLVSVAPIYLDVKHPINYAYDIYKGKPDMTILGEGGELETLYNNPAIASKVIVIIGESQSLFEVTNVTQDHAPNTFALEQAGKLVRFTNLTQMGSFTALAYKQLLRGMPIDEFEKDFYPLLTVHKGLNRPSLFASSRNMDWSEMSKQIEPEFDSLIDCNDFDSECTIIGNVDDSLFSKTVIPDFIKGKDAFFIIWQMNGSHNPLTDKSPQSYKITNDDYINSIHYGDALLGNLFKELPTDTWVVFMSDHSYGHNSNSPYIHSFVYHDNADLSLFAESKEAPLTQLDLLKTVYGLHGATFNDTEAYDVLHETVPPNRKRKTFSFYNIENVSIIGPKRNETIQEASR